MNESVAQSERLNRQRGGRVVIVTEAASAFPSGYIRALIYEPLFRRSEIDAAFIARRPAPLVAAGEALNRRGARLTARVMSRISVDAAYFRDQQIVRAAKNADAIYLQKTTSVELIRSLKEQTSCRVVYDLNDGVWLPSRSAFAHGKVTELLSLADAVTCDNEFGLRFAARYNNNCFLVPDPPQVEDFDQQRTARRDQSLITIGWVGSPETAFNLFSVWEPLERIFKRHQNVQLRLVGAGQDARLLPRWEHVRTSTLESYAKSELIREVLSMDIGIYPLFDIEDSRARGVLKASVYMSGGVCVIAQRNELTSALIHDGVNGFLADGASEWEAKLSLAIEDHALRRGLAEEGLRTVRSRYTVDNCFAHLVRALFP